MRLFSRKVSHMYGVKFFVCSDCRMYIDDYHIINIYHATYYIRFANFNLLNWYKIYHIVYTDGYSAVGQWCKNSLNIVFGQSLHYFLLQNIKEPIRKKTFHYLHSSSFEIILHLTILRCLKITCFRYRRAFIFINSFYFLETHTKD